MPKTFEAQLRELLGRQPTSEEVVIAFDFGTNGVLSGKTLVELAEEAHGG